MPHQKRSITEVSAHAKRQFPLLPASPTGANWSDVPDSVIVDLVRSFSDCGDAILFGKSQDESVLAIRVYRNGSPYSVYARGIERVGEAIERLYRMRPPRSRRDARASSRHPAVQALSNPQLPFHPRFTVAELAKQRQNAKAREDAWNALVSGFSVVGDRVVRV